MSYMFNESDFNGNLSEWTPYNLKDIRLILNQSNASMPYWAKIEDREERNKALGTYDLARELAQELNVNETSGKKLKI